MPKTQVKTAMRAGSRDNRTPFVGQTQFPTEGSKQFANKQSQESKAIAEKGPAPSYGGMSKVKYEVPTMKIAQDPLIQFLREDPEFQKQAAKASEELKTNIDSMLTQGKPDELQDESPNFSSDVERKRKQDEELLKNLFTHFPTESPSIG